MRSDDNGMVHGLVGAGVGAALVPGLVVDPNNDAVVALELGPRFPPCSIAVVCQRDRHQTPAARAFVERAQEVCAELAQTFLVTEAAKR